MLTTLSLLALLHAVLGAVILAAGGGPVAMVVILAATALGQLRLSGRRATRAVRARVVSVEDPPGLHARAQAVAATRPMEDRVERLARIEAALQRA